MSNPAAITPALCDGRREGRDWLGNRAMPRGSRLDLTRKADAILRGARCDAVTAARKDKHYRRNKQAKAKRLARVRRAKQKKFGKLGAASPVRRIVQGGC